MTIDKSLIGGGSAITVRSKNGAPARETSFVRADPLGFSKSSEEQAKAILANCNNRIMLKMKDK